MTEQKKKKSVNVGSLYKDPKTGNLYIKFDKPVKVTTYKGDTVETSFINLEKPQEEIARLLKYQVIDEEAAELRLSKIPENKKYNANVRL